MLLAAPLKLAVVLLAATEGEPSKLPFYIAGAIFAAWAVLVSVLGLRSPDFPGAPGRARLVMVISVVLALSAVSLAVATSGTPVHKGAAASARPAPGGTSAVAIAADPSGQLKYDTTSLRATPGKVVITFTNQSPVPHNVTLEVKGGAQVAATPTITGSRASITAALKPGTYTYFCSVDSHRQLGMMGTLVVG
jgi:plastocyanin